MTEQNDSAALARLSRQVRHLRLGVVLLASAMVAVVLVATTAPPADVIQARQFVVLGPKGEQFAVLGEREALFGKRYGLTLYDGSGKELASLTMSENAALAVPNLNGKPDSSPPRAVASLAFESGDSGKACLVGEKGLDVITSAQRCSIRSNSDTVAVIMTSDDKQPWLALNNDGLRVQDGLDKERIALTLGDAGGLFMLSDSNGTRRVSLLQANEAGAGLAVSGADGKALWGYP